MNQLLLAFYGDDFTGSNDAMESLARLGIRTILFVEPPGPEQLRRFEGIQAVGVAGVSRSLPTAEMDAELLPVFKRFRELNAPVFHYKVCSTFDSSPEIGSIGHAIDLGQETFASPFVPLLVGVPELWRYCVFGNLFARSGPESDVYRLDRHPTMRYHPTTPMTESDLRLHLSRQTAKKIGLTVLGTGRSLVLHTCRGPGDPRIEATVRRLAAVRPRALGAGPSTAKIFGEALGQIMREVLEKTGIRRAAIAGGDTSGYATRRMGIEALEVKAPFAPAMPMSRAHAAGTPLDGLEMVFKGGQTGKVDFFEGVRRGKP